MVTKWESGTRPHLAMRYTWILHPTSQQWTWVANYVTFSRMLHNHNCGKEGSAKCREVSWKLILNNCFMASLYALTVTQWIVEPFARHMKSAWCQIIPGLYETGLIDENPPCLGGWGVKSKVS
jgi:hypothetical protein